VGATTLQIEAVLCYLVDDVPVGLAPEEPWSQFTAAHATDFFHGPLRAPVGLAYPENDRVDKSKRVLEHQPLDLQIVAAAPELAGKEGPTDLDFPDLRLITVVAARANDFARSGAR